MLTQKEVELIKIASIKLRAKEDVTIKGDKFNNLCKFILEQIKLIFLDSNGKPLSMVAIIFNIKKIINFVKALILMIKNELS